MAALAELAGKQKKKFFDKSFSKFFLRIFTTPPKWCSG
jgi:hypothetical protein